MTQPAARAASRPERQLGKPLSGWRLALYTVIFEADTRAGRWFDQALLLTIVASVIIVVLDSVPAIHSRWGATFGLAEWVFTALFTTEYVLRLVCVQRPLVYARSFFGIIDLLSILPTWLALLVPEVHVFIIYLTGVSMVTEIFISGEWGTKLDRLGCRHIPFDTL